MGSEMCIRDRPDHTPGFHVATRRPTLFARPLAHGVSELVYLPSGLVFKCPFGQHLKWLRLEQQYKRLVAYLKPVLGDAFLYGVRFVVAHPVQSNLFLQTLKFNYPPFPPGG